MSDRTQQWDVKGDDRVKHNRAQSCLGQSNKNINMFTKATVAYSHKHGRRLDTAVENIANIAESHRRRTLQETQNKRQDAGNSN